MTPTVCTAILCACGGVFESRHLSVFLEAQQALYYVTVVILRCCYKCVQMWTGVACGSCLLFLVLAPSSLHCGQKTGGASFSFLS